MMTENKKLVPKRRFKEFKNSNAWEQRKVKDLFSITRGYVLAANKTSETKSEEMVYPVYSSQTKDKGLMGYYNEYLYEDAITWTTDGANAGTVNYRPGKFYCTNVCGVLLSKEIDADKMMSAALNNVAKNHVSYVGNPKLMNNVMADIDIFIPKDKQERKLISEYFTKIDNLITLHQRKLEKMKALKAAYLSEMFPAEGERMPKRRFKAFTNAWEQRKLVELSNFITKGATPTTYGFKWEEDGIPFFRNDSIKDNRFIFGEFSYISEDANTALIRSEVRSGDILVAITGDIGKVGIVPENIEKANINQHMAKVRIKKDAYPYFVYQFLSTDKMQEKYKRIKTGISMPQLSLEQIRDIDITLPSMEEQKKIGDYFENFENLITLHQRNLEKLHKIKNAYLNEMFVGGER